MRTVTLLLFTLCCLLSNSQNYASKNKTDNINTEKIDIQQEVFTANLPSQISAFQIEEGLACDNEYDDDNDASVIVSDHSKRFFYQREFSYVSTANDNLKHKGLNILELDLPPPFFA